MKILILPSWYPSEMDPNGVPFIRAQARSLVKYGFDVDVVFTQPYSLKTVAKRKTFMFGVRDNNNEGVREILSYFPKTHIKRFDQFVRLIMGKRRIRALFREGNLPDVIHAHTLYAGPLALWVKKTYGIPLITTEHYTGFARNIVKPWEARIARRMYRHSTYNLAVSGSFADILNEKNGVTFTELPNMVNTDLFQAVKRERGEHFTYLFVGSLHDKKNPLMLLEGFKKIYGEDRSVRLIMVGEGELEGTINEQISRENLQDGVTLKGFLHGPDVAKLMEQADCLVLPSRFETFGIVVIEAMSSGLPVIVTKSGGPESFVKEGLNGLIVEQDEEELCGAMKNVRTVTWEPHAIRRYVLDNFSEKAVIGRIKEIYTKCISGPLVVQGVREINLSSGISKVAYETARELTERGVPVTTITQEWDRTECREEMGKVVVMKVPAFLDRLPLYLRKYIKTLLFTYRTESFYRYEKKGRGTVTIAQRDAFSGDIAVGHSCHREAVEIKKKQGKKFWFLNPVHPLYLKQERKIYRKPYPQLASISRSISGEFRRHYGLPEDHIHIIPNGVDTEAFSNENRSEDHRALCSELNLPWEVDFLLFVGNEFHRKGLGLIIEAMSLNEGSNRHLLVLGEDNKKEYEALAKEKGLADQVHFLGRRRGIEKYFSAASLFILPVNYEPFGLVGIEAMSCGTPVLVTEVGGFRDYVVDGKNGFFIKREKEDIAGKIDAVFGNGEIWLELSKNARLTALDYDWSKIGQKYYDLVKEVYEKKQNARK